jgi:hypothetical protein
MSALSRRATTALLCLLFLTAIYRAKTQSLTVDEAWAFHLYVDRSWSQMILNYDAANHVLHTILTKSFREWLGTSELVLRLSSLVGCLVYFTAVHRLSGLLFGHRLYRVLAVAALTLNPLLFDFMVASRGYGLALGLYTWSVYAALSYLVRGWHLKWLTASGVLAGLSMAANLTFVVPAMALGFVLLLFSLRSPAAGRMWRVVDSYGGPALAIGFALNILPLLEARPEDFYLGTATVREAIWVFFQECFGNHRHRWPMHIVARNSGWLQVLLGPILVAAVAALALIKFFPERRERLLSFRTIPFLAITATMLTSLAAVLILAQFGVPYPWGRSGLYLVFLLSLAAVAAVPLVDRNTLRHIGTVAVAAVVFLYVRQFDTRSFVEWRFDASTRSLVERLAEVARPSAAEATVEVAASPLLKNTVSYYKGRRRLDWLQLTEVSSGVEFLLFTEEESNSFPTVPWETIHRDGRTGTILARVRSQP